MKTTAFAFVILLAFCATGCGSSRYENMSEAQIQAELLRDVPLGSSSERVRSYLKRKAIRDPTYMRDFYTLEEKAIIRNGRIINLRYYAGAVYAAIANYGAFFLVSTEVQTRWEFDAHDRLIDLRVTKQAIGP
jgi:hypothetical protein